MTTLPVSLQNALHDIVERTNLAGASIRSILLSTTEGVPLGRCIIDTDVMDYSTTNNANVESSSAVIMNEEVISSIESIWAPASKQFPVFGLQKLKQVTAIYDHGILFQIYQTPLVITILCGPQSNIGAVRSTAIPLLMNVLEPLLSELGNMLQVDPESSSATTPTTTATTSSLSQHPNYPATTFYQ